MDHDNGALSPRDFFHRAEKRFFRFRGRQISIENVSRYEYDVHVFGFANFGNFIKSGNLFGQTFRVHQPLSDMPIGGMKDVHVFKKLCPKGFAFGRTICYTIIHCIA